MELDAPTPLLGGLSPAAFMRRHWQRRPMLVRRAWPGVQPPLARAALFALAGDEGVESRLVERQGRGRPARWSVRHGPLPRRALPPMSRPGWTLLVQGLDLHVDAAHAMLQRFAFVPQARLDDLMVSWASEGGGVGPHVDAYDVFLLQVQGRRRWRTAPVDRGGAAFRPGLPLRILQRFEPDEDHVLEPGDLLYLPPGWAHDGVAVGGDCMTCSIGFRTPSRTELAAELLQRIAEGLPIDGDAARYRDPGQPAAAQPGAVPPALQAFARDSVARALREPAAVAQALGEVLSEPKPRVVFEPGDALPPGAGVRLARASRMLHDERHVYLNGESFRAAGRDATLMRRLADRRRLSAVEVERLSAGARALLDEWVGAGWLVADHPEG
jgi:50S ribosomal protein L16 3-hydroxylase